MLKTPKPRRRLLVNVRRQMPYLFGLSILAAVNTVIVLFILTWIFAYSADERVALRMNSMIAYKVFGVLAVTTITSAVWTLIVTRNTIGLLEKVTSVLRLALNGEWQEGTIVKFRKKDRDFGELEMSLQQVVDRLGNAEKVPSEVTNSLDKLVNDLRQNNLNNEDAAEHAKLIREMIAKGER